jgi:hypothetical protein
MMIRHLTATTAIAAALMAGAVTGGQLTLTSMSGPLSDFSHAAPAAGAAKCPGNLTSGTIGGQSKCLGAGQQCQQAHAGDYTRFGFSCGKVGNRYQLTAKGGARPGAKPGFHLPFHSSTKPTTKPTTKPH